MAMGFVRFILTVVLLLFVYRETGVATTLMFALVALSNEAAAFWMRRTQQAINRLAGKI